MIKKLGNIRKRVFALFLIFFCMPICGCGKDEILLFSDSEEAISSEATSVSSEKDVALEDNTVSSIGGTTDSKENAASENGNYTSEKSNDSIDSTDNLQKENSASDNGNGTKSPEDTIYVYICGAVRYPGVYAVSQTSRIYEAVDLAGGILENASSNAVNLASYMEDGEMIYIPTVDEVSDGTYSISGDETTTTADDGLVNINTAGQTELMTLSGIGEMKAQSIIEYRQNNGAFKNIEDIMLVSGIGDGCFQKIRDYIKVE
ncbi:MAG: helix-hairpin-helix domain-containing protein [Lachnospiraceae bacterium]|nr:helix-hairpin-helix domain-containing protein [Lachnospiraceae bacterium]